MTSNPLLSHLTALSTPNADGLLPCPMNHDSEGQVVLRQFGIETNYVHCLGCGFSSGGHPTPELAIAAWNTRSLDAAKVRELVEGMEERLDGYRIELNDARSLIEFLSTKEDGNHES